MTRRMGTLTAALLLAALGLVVAVQAPAEACRPTHRSPHACAHVYASTHHLHWWQPPFWWTR